MTIVKLLGTRKDRAKSFYWLMTHGDTAMYVKDEILISYDLFQEFKKHNFKYKELKDR